MRCHRWGWRASSDAGGGAGARWRRRGRLGGGVLGARLLVDPALELGVVDEAALLAELGLDGLVAKLLFLLGTATEPSAESPALLGRFSLSRSFRWSNWSVIRADICFVFL